LSVALTVVKLVQLAVQFKLKLELASEVREVREQESEIFVNLNNFLVAYSQMVEEY
jgi:hypothetical protein